MDLIFNDERLIDNPALDSQIENEHRHRYKTAACFSHGKRVLDAACGSGYGSDILAEHAQSVVGIDYSGAVIGYCNRTFQRENLSFLPMSATELVFPDNSFDMVVSFETIEHLKQEDQEQFLEGIRRVLTEDGLLIMSSPNCDLWERTVNHGENKHHLHELTFTEFRNLVAQYFKNVTFYYQSYQPVSLITDAVVQTPLHVHYSDNYKDSTSASYIIAVCSNRPLEEKLSGIYLQETEQAAVEKQLGFVEMNLYCDCGNGFTETDKISSPVRFASDGKYRVDFTLRNDAAALRFDPGKQPCTIWGLTCSDAQISFRALNGVQLTANSAAFWMADPILLLEGRKELKRGEQISVCFEYQGGLSAMWCRPISAPLESYPNPLQQYAHLFARNAELAKQYLELEQKYIIASARNAELAKQYLELEQTHASVTVSHERELERQLAQTRATLSGILTSRSWRVTAPLRKLMEWLRRRR